MNTAYAIQFKGGSYLGGGHAHGVPLYKADLFESYDDAEAEREERAKSWIEMQFAKVVRVILSPNQ